MFTSILAPLDGSEIAERAIPYAEQLALRTNGRLVLLRVVASLAPDAPKAMVDRAREDAEEYLGDVVNLAVDRRATTKRVVSEGDPSAVILRTIVEEGIDTVVMCSHGRTGMGRVLRGSVADHVVRNASVPVLLAPRHAGITWWDAQPKRLLLPLDGSGLSEAAVPYAARLAHVLGATVVLLRTVGYDQQFNFELFFRDTREDARAYLQGVAADLQAQGVHVVVEVREGRALSSMLTVADEYGVHGIVMASHGRGGMSRALLGSNADAVLHAARIPTLVVHPGRLGVAVEDFTMVVSEWASTGVSVAAGGTPDVAEPGRGIGGADADP